MIDVNEFMDFLQKIGPPTQDSVENLLALERDCENRKDPNSFYLTFNISSPPSISWDYNVDHLLGVPTLTYDLYTSLIHPDWVPLHVSFGAAAYLVARRFAQKRFNKLTVYTTNVPIRHQSGKYHWYKQVSFPAAVDSNGYIINHLNQYHRLCDYDKLIPIRPKITVDDVWLSEYDLDFVQAGNFALEGMLKGILTPANHLILNTYRTLTTSRDGKWISPSKKAVRERLSSSASAVNKANVRIIQAVKGRFPDSVTHDVATFSAFLNDLCGLP
ncbi:hypothetical protein FUA23_06270 [Neolewinella aurantiaca]|uniref:Uncharacterized protein n=1 Tax=Neolewinella aurantiaca TaxID=2602767 RepID=A0A5C7FXW3_9BACT|nr:hypothetical protein [Neolewinella aurantiaca]TXF90392.1 hypothetical protein FUA23_06270 [Neolewinella aurantiaca]